METKNNNSKNFTINHNTSAEYDFNNDVLIGENGEEIIKNFLISKGYKYIDNNKDNKYDLLMSYKNKNYTYEIKTDVFLSPKKDTGNIAIEFSSRGKFSGIKVTQADFFVYYIPKLGEIWNIKTSDLLNLIEKENFKVTTGGDIGSNTKMYLIKRKDYKSYFKIHKLKLD
jgi:hypothetical protein